MTLADGARLRVRPIVPADREPLADAFARLSERSRHQRFLAPKPRLSTRELDYLTDVDHVTHEALVAIDETSGDIVASGATRPATAAARWPTWPWSSPIAWQRRGIGHALAARLVERARANGITRLTGTALADNRRVRSLLDRLGFRVRSVGAGVVEVELDVAPARAAAPPRYRCAPRTVGQLLARAQGELGEHAREVTLDRAHGHEERLSDLAVGEAVARQLGHAPLARRQRLDPAQGHAPRLGAGGAQLGLGEVGQRRGARVMGDVERLAQHRARLGAPAGGAHQHPELGQRPRALERDPRALEALDALAQERLALAAARDRSGGAQGHPERALPAEGARELDLLPWPAVGPPRARRARRAPAPRPSARPGSPGTSTRWRGRSGRRRGCRSGPRSGGPGPGAGARAPGAARPRSASAPLRRRRSRRAPSPPARARPCSAEALTRMAAASLRYSGGAATSGASSSVRASPSAPCRSPEAQQQPRALGQAHAEEGGIARRAALGDAGVERDLRLGVRIGPHERDRRLGEPRQVGRLGDDPRARGERALGERDAGRRRLVGVDGDERRHRQDLARDVRVVGGAAHGAHARGQARRRRGVEHPGAGGHRLEQHARAAAVVGQPRGGQVDDLDRLGDLLAAAEDVGQDERGAEAHVVVAGRLRAPRAGGPRPRAGRRSPRPPRARAGSGRARRAPAARPGRGAGSWPPTPGRRGARRRARRRSAAPPSTRRRPARSPAGARPRARRCPRARRAARRRGGGRACARPAAPPRGSPRARSGARRPAGAAGRGCSRRPGGRPPRPPRRRRRRRGRPPARARRSPAPPPPGRAARRPAGRRLRRTSIARPTVRAPRASTRGASAAVGATPSSRSASTSSRTRKGTPPVVRRQAAAKSGSGARPRPVLDEAPDRAGRERRRAQHARERIGEQEREQRRGGALGLRARGHHERERQLLQPRQQEGQEAQGGRVGPVRVVDGEHERAVAAEVRAQPVEAVQHGERRVGGRHLLPVRARARQPQQPPGHAGRPLEQVVAGAGRDLGQGRLEQLAHDAEGEVALELAAARAQRPRARGVRERAGGADEGRLADARGPLDHEQAAVATLRARHRGLDARQLGVALEDVRAGPRRGAH